MEKGTILVLGGEGFIGKNIIDFFSGKYDCISVDSKESVFSSDNNRKLLEINPYQEKVGLRVDFVVHLIDNQLNSNDFLEAEKRLVNNLNLSKNSHLVVFSSSVIYANPDSEYGKRKIALERFYTEYCLKNNIKLSIVRLFNVFGPYQLPFRQGSLVPNVICNYLNGKETEITNREIERDIMYAGDIGKFLEYIFNKKLTGIYDIGSGQLSKITDLLDFLEADVVKKEILIKYSNKIESITPPVAKGELIDEIKTTNVKEGLRKTFLFYEENIDILNKS